NFSNNVSADWPDPFQMRIYQTSLQLILGGFSEPYEPIRDFQLMEINAKAQQQIVYQMAAKGDGVIPAGGLEWSSPHSDPLYRNRRLYLRVYRRISRGFT
ncbi:MAG: hypothetical protein Q9183_004565, partial [Haloplaca sp. 2 TL-2023]